MLDSSIRRRADNKLFHPHHADYKPVIVVRSGIKSTLEATKRLSRTTIS